MGRGSGRIYSVSGAALYCIEITLSQVEVWGVGHDGRGFLPLDMINHVLVVADHLLQSAVHSRIRNRHPTHVRSTKQTNNIITNVVVVVVVIIHYVNQMN